MIKNEHISTLVDSLSQRLFNVIDVREAGEYASGHVPGAINIPLSEFANRYTELDKNTHYHIICQMGGRSAQASLFLDGQGYDVTNIDGGTASWLGELEH